MPARAYLNDREKAFCRHYVACGETAKAAIKAGYSKRGARQTASRVLKRPNVTLKVSQLKEKVHQNVDRMLTVTSRSGRNKILDKLKGAALHKELGRQEAISGQHVDEEGDSDAQREILMAFSNAARGLKPDGTPL